MYFRFIVNWTEQDVNGNLKTFSKSFVKYMKAVDFYNNLVLYKRAELYRRTLYGGEDILFLSKENNKESFLLDNSVNDVDRAVKKWDQKTLKEVFRRMHDREMNKKELVSVLEEMNSEYIPGIDALVKNKEVFK
jgi:vacuolar-type H+-ATPase catalytic subunit A/Vma1